MLQLDFIHTILHVFAIGFDAYGEIRNEVQIRVFLVSELMVKNRDVFVTIGFLGISFGLVVNRPVVELFFALATTSLRCFTANVDCQFLEAA